MIRAGLTQRAIGLQFKVKEMTISNLATGRSWGWLKRGWRLLCQIPRIRLLEGARAMLTCFRTGLTHHGCQTLAGEARVEKGTYLRIDLD